MGTIVIGWYVIPLVLSLSGVYINVVGSFRPGVREKLIVMSFIPILNLALGSLLFVGGVLAAMKEYHVRKTIRRIRYLISITSPEYPELVDELNNIIHSLEEDLWRNRMKDSG